MLKKGNATVWVVVVIVVVLLLIWWAMSKGETTTPAPEAPVPAAEAPAAVGATVEVLPAGESAPAADAMVQ